MNDRQVREEAAFKIRFADIVSGKPGFDHEDDPSADVKIDGEAVPRTGRRTCRKRARRSSPRRRDAQDGPGYPCVHFIAKFDIDRRDRSRRSGAAGWSRGAMGRLRQLGLRRLTEERDEWAR